MRFKELRAKLNETATIAGETIPSPMLVLRRRGIRVFPDGKHVALYTNDKYNLIFTIPYGSSAGNPANPIVGQPGMPTNG
jgi:hypothetical protein